MKRLGIIFGIILTILCDSAMAQTLQPVTDGGINWWPIAIATVAIVVVISAVVFWRKRSPNAPQAVPAAHSELVNAISALVAKMGQTTVGQTGSGMSFAEPTVAVGKLNAPGTFTLEVTGDPATDMAAINAQYFG